MKDANQLNRIYIEIKITNFVKGLVDSISENGIEGLFSFPTKITNNLVTSPTTNTSHIPANIARGKILYKDFLLSFERILINLKNKFIVKLYIII